MVRIRNSILIKEMKRREYKHLNSLPDYNINSYKDKGFIDLEYNYLDLINRCPECRKNILKGESYIKDLHKKRKIDQDEIKNLANSILKKKLNGGLKK